MSAPSGKARAVLLDLDGTLLDTAPDMATALNRLLAEQDQPPLPFAAIRPQVSHGSNAVVRAGFPAADSEHFERLRARFLELYSACLAEQTRPFPGFDAVLDELDARGIPWGIVTNKPAFLTLPLLAALQMQQRVGCVLSGDSLPERKPHPRPLLVAAQQLGIPPAQCLYLGDAERDITAARAAGMIALGAGFGYLGTEDQPQTWGAAAWLDSPAELLDWVGMRADRE